MLWHGTSLKACVVFLYMSEVTGGPITHLLSPVYPIIESLTILKFLTHKKTAAVSNALVTLLVIPVSMGDAN